MSKKDEAVSVEVDGSIYSAKVDRVGEWLLTLAIPLSDGVKAAALASMTETRFKVKFTPQED